MAKTRRKSKYLSSFALPETIFPCLQPNVGKYRPARSRWEGVETGMKKRVKIEKRFWINKGGGPEEERKEGRGAEIS